MQPHPPAKAVEQNGLPPHKSHGDDEKSIKEDHVINGCSPNVEHPVTNSASGVTNGTATGISAAATLTTNKPGEETATKVSPTTRRKGILKGLFGKERKPRKNSQKPLLYSQSSTTPGDRYSFLLLWQHPCLFYL